MCCSKYRGGGARGITARCIVCGMEPEVWQRGISMFIDSRCVVCGGAFRLRWDDDPELLGEDE